MKYIICFVFVNLLPRWAAAQADSAAHSAMSQRLMELYNAKSFAQIYSLCSADFTNAVPAAEVETLFSQGIWEELGPMTAIHPLGSERGVWLFRADFRSGNLGLQLLLNKHQQIDLMQFLPWQAERPRQQVAVASDNPLRSQLDSVVDRAVRATLQIPPGCGLSIGLKINGVVQHYNFGSTGNSHPQLPDANSIYEIGSVTKTFCGLLLAMAVEEKKIGLDDEITRYLPGSYPNLPKGKKAIRIVHLANHTSGLPRLPDNLKAAPGYDSLNPYRSYTQQLLIRALKDMAPAHDPGTVCEYSNYGMALLGAILEKVYGTSFEQLVKEKITQPNGMSSTAVNLTPEQLELSCQGHNADGQATPAWELNGFVAAGGLHASTRDLLVYLDYNRREPDAATRLAHQPSFTDRPVMGLAWFIFNTKAGNHLVWHNGATYGFSSFCGYFQEKEIEISLLSNYSATLDTVALSILNHLEAVK